jgi:hypothetical protein
VVPDGPQVKGKESIGLGTGTDGPPGGHRLHDDPLDDADEQRGGRFAIEARLDALPAL